ncbi:MAG: hypothetical protein ABI919_05075 [Ramlibacter sp.]
MPKVLLVWEQGGNLGHLARLLPIARSLRDKGAETEFVIPGQGVARSTVECAGFRWSAAPSLALSAGEGPAINHADVLLRCAFGLPTDQLHARVLQWQSIFVASAATAAVIDASPLALYAARSMGLNAVALGHGFEIPTTFEPHPCFAPWLAGAAERALRCDEQLAHSIDGLAQLFGTETAPRSLNALYAPPGTALCTWPELDHFERPPGFNTPYIGPIWSDLPGAQPQAFAPRPGPKVLAYLNLVDKRHDLLWQALGKCGANVLVISPSGDARAAEAARGRGIEVVERAVLLAPLLKASDAVVSNGGIGLCSMALQSAKPLLLLPEHVEQGILANRLARQGLAAATIRWGDKANIFQRAETLLGAGTPAPALLELAARRAAFSPAEAVNQLVFRLLPDALQ